MNDQLNYVSCQNRLPKEPIDSLNFNTWEKYNVKINNLSSDSIKLRYAGNGQWCDDNWDFYDVLGWYDIENKRGGNT